MIAKFFVNSVCLESGFCWLVIGIYRWFTRGTCNGIAESTSVGPLCYENVCFNC